jgi:hypothetical protein
MKYLYIIAVWIALGVSGQASVVLAADDELPVWYKPGVTPERLEGDTDECERNARMQSPSFGNSMIGASRMQDLQQRCIQSKDYYLVRKDGTRIN